MLNSVPFPRGFSAACWLCGALLFAVAGEGVSQVAWTQLDPPARPSRRSGHAMVYDASRDSYLLYGGSDQEHRLGDTWEFAGGNWREVSAGGADVPPALTAHAMVYDASRRRAVLFGGQLGIFDASGELQTVFNGEVYELSGAAWEQVPVPEPRPEARAAHAMAYDSRRGRVWMFGGRKKIDTLKMELLNDTWYYDGGIPAWVRVDSATSPSPRESCSMVYDPSRDRVYLSGGGFFRNKRSNETWSLDPGTGQWSRVPTDATPSARQNAAIAYVGNGKTVLFGGSEADVGIDGETWIFEGEEWSMASPPARPRARAAAALAPGATPELALLFGGAETEESLNDTWVLSFLPTPTPTPSPSATPSPGPTATPGPMSLYDLTGDRVLDGLDIFLLARQWHLSVPGKAGAAFLEGDLDGSGGVDAGDLLLLIEGWAGRESPSP